MEGSSNWEYKKLIDELSHGMERAKQLQFHLCLTSPSETRDLLLQRIITTFEKAFLILRWSAGSVGQARLRPATSAALNSSISFDRGVRNDDINKNFKNYCDHGDTSRKRKSQPIWTEQVRVNPENGLEGPTDDGYSWRKYGQKDILGAKYPRSYYRCTYRLLRNCWATKQVQRSDDDPTVFEITYKGTHTCNGCTNEPGSLEKQELRQNTYHHQVEQQNQTFFNVKTNLRVNTGDLDNMVIPTHFPFPTTFGHHEGENRYTPISAPADDNQAATYSPMFYSSATSGSNYVSAATYKPKSNGEAPMQHSESDTADIISAHASTTNSPIGGMEFSIDPVDLDPNFPFNIPGFFTL